MADEPQLKIHRPTPHLEVSTRYRGPRNTDHVLTVSASYAADLADVEDTINEREPGEEPNYLPNNIKISVSRNAAGGGETAAEFRMTRDAAENLRDQLQMALDWNGK